MSSIAKKVKIIIIGTDNWVQIYINGELWHSEHSFDSDDLEGLLNKLGYKVVNKYIEDSEKYEKSVKTILKKHSKKGVIQCQA